MHGATIKIKGQNCSLLFLFYWGTTPVPRPRPPCSSHNLSYCTTCLLLKQQEFRRKIEASLRADRIIESVVCRRIIIQLLRIAKFR